MDDVSNRWQVLVGRGIGAVAFGLLALLVPGLTLGALLVLFAAYAVFDGALAALVGWRLAPDDPARRFHLAEGLVGVVASGVGLLWPRITAFAVLVLVALWALATGAARLLARGVSVGSERRSAADRGGVATGVLSVAFGGALLLFAATAVGAVIWWLGVFALALGGAFLGAGLRRRAGADHGGAAETASFGGA